MYEVELYRLKGELLLAQESQKAKGKAQKSKVPNPKSQILNPNPQGEAEACFLKAINVARRQRAKSLELRAVMSLVRLRQGQVRHRGTRHTQHDSHAKLDEAHSMLSEVYNRFTEGFDTLDLKEAKALLGELSGASLEEASDKSRRSLGQVSGKSRTSLGPVTDTSRTRLGLTTTGLRLTRDCSGPAQDLQ